MKAGKKSLEMGGKGLNSGMEPTPELIAKVNCFALDPLKAEDVYIRKFLLAHNGVDRDRERFSETILEDFAQTLPGKGFLFAHDRRNYLPLGLFFDAFTEAISPEQFKALTGEEIRLPENASMAKVLWAFMYTLKECNQDIIQNLNAGIYRHVSIGFAASDLAPVKGAFDQTLYWEYAAPGEAVEGSLVWLGAQPGATAQKQADNERGEATMKKEFIKQVNILTGQDLPEDAGEETVAKAVETALKSLKGQISSLEAKAAENEALATAGKAFVDGLVEDYSRMKAALGESQETPEAAESIKKFARSMPLDFLKQEVKHLEQRMEKQFPPSQLPGDAGTNRESGAQGADNPLIPQ